jgi:hypothetical protein
MGEAAPQAEDIEQALSYLRLFWGGEFMIGHDEHGYWSTRHGHVGGRIIRAAAPDKLGELMNGAGQ